MNTYFGMSCCSTLYLDVDLLDAAVALSLSLSLQALPVVKVELDTPSEHGWRQRVHGNLLVAALLLLVPPNDGCLC
jgi:hypothetical protein